ncbi:MAG: tyrosine-type recombinase/integrase [Chloroflexota bacterium]|nr:tyrosine-type recombinase/integrase [Chloroflexota bacterium]
MALPIANSRRNWTGPDRAVTGTTNVSPGSRHSKVYLEPDEVMALERATSNARDRLLVRLLFHLGCRVSEALALDVQDVDFARGTVTILHLKTRIRLACPRCQTRLGRSHAFCPGCGTGVQEAVSQEHLQRKQRTLPVDNDTLRTLKQHIERGGPIRRGDREFLFGINRHRAWQVVRKCAEMAGVGKLVNPDTGKLRGVSPHRLRDAFAVHAMKHDDSGDALRLLQEHLGHASFNTTAKYRKVAGEEHRRWYEGLWRKQGVGADENAESG